MKMLATIQRLSMQIHGVVVKKNDIEEREQAGASVAIICTVSTLKDC